MSEIQEDIEYWVTEFMAKKCITNYDLEFSGSCPKGDNYLGEVHFAKVIARPEKGEETYHLVIKTPKKSDEFREQTPIMESFEREIVMYTEIFPIFKKFQINSAIDKPFDNIPECYSVCREFKRESIVLKNLKLDGYEIFDRNMVQNLNHVLFVFQSYGKFHAISLALRKRKPALFNSLTNTMTDVMGQFLLRANMIPRFKEDFAEGIKALRNSGKETLAKKFDGFVEQLGEYLKSDLDPDSPQFVILHGDCWNNNMMFKYEGDNKDKPSDMYFIDFQMARVASPVYDLSYYLYSCVDKTVLDHFDLLLRTYYASLSDYLKQLGCDPDEIFTLKQLKDHWRKYGKFGLSMAPFIIKMTLCDSDEVVDFAESFENEGGFKESYNFKLKQHDVCTQRVVDVLSHFAENFL